MLAVVTLLSASKHAAASLILPIFNAFIAILKPPPLLESIFSTGTLVSLKNICLVDEE